jgi:outer membrane protein insertion porin family
VSWGAGLNGQTYPVFKNSYSGGLGSVRGFEQGSLGPRDTSTDSAIGGPKKITLNAELMAPLPGAGNDRTLRMFAFVDAGNVFKESANYSLAELRVSTGVGISWISPVGPLRFALAKPLSKEAGDRIEPFQFQIGTAF